MHKIFNYVYFVLVEHQDANSIELLCKLLYPRGFGKNVIFIKNYEVNIFNNNEVKINAHSWSRVILLMWTKKSAVYSNLHHTLLPLELLVKVASGRLFVLNKKCCLTLQDSLIGYQSFL